jgi:hypothetical protein
MQHGPWLASNERNDCGVVALANAADLSYDWAYEIAKASGRRAGCCSYVDKVAEAARVNGVKLRKLAMRPRTLAKFLRERPEGRYYVRVGHHIVAVVNGVITDRTKPTKIVTHAYAILYADE